MIGKIIIGKSFRGCINYCLHDKLQTKGEMEQIMHGRAEVISFNQCFGNAKELIAQFNDVRNLNLKISKPVLHITLSLAPGEKLGSHQLTELVNECAKDLGFEKNQFLSVLHNDTSHQHLHIVSNRIGFDGKTLSDSNNYQKIAKFCRRMEEKFGLQKVSNPNFFLPKEMRVAGRLDTRKVKLKEDIQRCLVTAKTHEQFVANMTALKYEVIKSRGIAFRDAQKVYTKGSEVGYSLSAIEKVLSHKQEQTIGINLPSSTGQHPYIKQLEKSQSIEKITDIQQDKSLPLVASFKSINPVTDAPVSLPLKRRKKRKHRHL